MVWTLVLMLLVHLIPTLLVCQEDTIRSNSLRDDAFLHPIDCITPYTLKKGEWIYAQSFQTLPFPSWAFYGITDRLTTQIDLLPWLYGILSEFRKPIPSINFRYRLIDQKGYQPTMAVEMMFVHFWDTLKRFETPSLTVWENGSYFHFKPVIGYQWKNNIAINLSIGVEYMKEMTMINHDTNNPMVYTNDHPWNPNASIGVDYRPSHWWSLHIGYSFGSTLTYLENVPRKHQWNYGFRIAPFYKNRFGILRNLRVELVGINAYFPDIDAYQGFPIPIYPYIYWQWRS